MLSRLSINKNTRDDSAISPKMGRKADRVVTVRKRWPTEGKGKGKVWGLGSTEGIRYGKVWALRAYRAQGVRCTLSLCVLWAPRRTRSSRIA